jgi:hypothetical protein
MGKIGRQPLLKRGYRCLSRKSRANGVGFLLIRAKLSAANAQVKKRIKFTGYVIMSHLLSVDAFASLLTQRHTMAPPFQKTVYSAVISFLELHTG